MRQAFQLWFIPAVVTTLLCIFINAAVQHDFRSSANDPQVQLAEDGARSLAYGKSVAAFDRDADAVDIARSLAPWVAVYDAAGDPLSSTGRLDAAAPALPAGVFAYTRMHGEDRVTWQPRTGVRSAIVVTWAAGPRPRFVVAGRSLREVESRVDELNGVTLAAWCGSLVVVFLLAWLASRRSAAAA